MINLFKIKGQKREDAANANGRAPVKKQSAGELRLHKGLFVLENDLLVAICLTPCCFRTNSVLTDIKKFFL